MKVVQSKRNLSTTDDTDRSYSPHIWSDCPLEDILSGRIAGVVYEDDFVSFPKTPATTEGNFGQYAQFSSSGGTITAGTGQGGEMVLGEATDNEGVSFRTLSTPFKISRASKKLWFEARLKRSTIADTTAGIFVGLMEDAALTATVPITAAGALADQNLVGFLFPEGDGDQAQAVYKANGVTAVTVEDDCLNTAMVADTYTKVGMVFEPKPDLYSGTKFVLTYLQNGRILCTKTIPSTDGDDFPNDVGLGFVMAILLAASSAFTATIDKVRVVQLLEDMP